MKNKFLLLALSVLLFATSCKKTTVVDDDDVPVTPSNTVEVSGEISTNTTWSASKIYLLKGFVYVSNGATLTIEPGTIIKGDKASKATLIVTRGSKINATGTADKPIVFTSALPMGARDKGDWGGIILLGKAPTNQGTDVKIEGGPVAPTGKDEKVYTFFGGTDAADNSGTLKYVRIEYAGVEYTVNSEINGLTLGGVGSGTTLDYIQVYRSGDDAFEWFGGTVNAKHLLAIGTWDDDFDTDFGYSGNIQFALAQRVPLKADQSGSNSFESDNNANGTDDLPKTAAVFSNVSILGPIQKAGLAIETNYQNGAQIRRNSSISILNSVISGYPVGIYIDDTKVTTAGSTSTNYSSGSMVLANNLIYGIKGLDVSVSTAAVAAAIEAKLRTDNTFDKLLFATNAITTPYMYGTELGIPGSTVGTANFTVLAGSAAASGAAFTNAKVSGSFFDKVSYRGAFGTDDWSAGWAHFNPQTLAYTTPGAVK